MGLMAPSRKKYDYFTPKTGEYVKPERRTTAVYSESRNSSGSTTLYTVPTGKRAKIIYWNHMTNADYSTFYIGSTLLSRVQANMVAGYATTFEEGIDLSSGQTLVLTANGAGFGGTCIAVAIIVEEEAASGYYVSSAWNF